MFTETRNSVGMKIVSLISAFVLVVGVSPITASAATLFTEDFGSGSSVNDIAGWDESGQDSAATTRSTQASSGNDSISPNGGRFAVIGMEEWICRSITTSGYDTLTMSYFWRGDDNAENNDFGRVEYKISGNCDDSSGWTNLKSHDMSIDNSWSTQSAFALPGALNNTTFLLRVRADSSNNGEDFRIDGIVISGITIVVDTDNDTIPDASDNCPSTANTNQANNDNDALGDVCDTDDDNDTVIDTTDNCVFDANLNQLDSDGDGIGNECDDTPYTDEQLCEQAGDNWIEGDCYTDAEACELQEGYSWNGSECVTDEVPPTPEEECVQGGGFWNGESCEEIPTCDEGYSYNSETNQCDEVIVPPTPQESCIADGDYWVDGECIADNIICDVFGELNIPMPEQCEEEEQPTDEELCEAQEGMSWVNEECVADESTPGDTDEETSGNENTEEPRPSSRGHVDPMCNNNEDDDNDGLYDVNDPDCESATDNSENGGGSVLGAATCAATITEYMKMGANNNPEQVKLLQEFLNKELGLSLIVSGEFDQATFDAVMAFQNKYAEEVLTPWGTTSATGYAYKTTLRMIHKIMCPGVDVPMPELN